MSSMLGILGLMCDADACRAAATNAASGDLHDLEKDSGVDSYRLLMERSRPSLRSYRSIDWRNK